MTTTTFRGNRLILERWTNVVEQSKIIEVAAVFIGVVLFWLPYTFDFSSEYGFSTTSTGSGQGILLSKKETFCLFSVKAISLGAKTHQDRKTQTRNTDQPDLLYNDSI